MTNEVLKAPLEESAAKLVNIVRKIMFIFHFVEFMREMEEVGEKSRCEQILFKYALSPLYFRASFSFPISGNSRSVIS